MSFDVYAISRHFALSAPVAEIIPFGNGLINHTFRIRCEDGSLYTLQKINTNVFRDPVSLTDNIVGVCPFMKEKIAAQGGDITREVVRPVPTHEGSYYYESEQDGFWRIHHYIDDARGYDSAEKPGLLHEAAYAFGLFQRRLGDYPAETLHETIKDFHNTDARYAAFEEALRKDAAGRADALKPELDILVRRKEYASAITSRLANGTLPTRVTHNDTKLNNVLIDDATGKGLCVIDLDTVMPGSLLYDFGDAIRFACNHSAEDDPDVSNIWLDLSLYEEYVSGFLRGVGDAITPEEKALLPLSAFVLTYELALRFMTDYLNGDVYFKVAYEEHNLVRTRAQIKLMEDMLVKLDDMKAITEKY